MTSWCPHRRCGFTTYESAVHPWRCTQRWVAVWFFTPCVASVVNIFICKVKCSNILHFLVIESHEIYWGGIYREKACDFFLLFSFCGKHLYVWGETIMYPAPLGYRKSCRIWTYLRLGEILRWNVQREGVWFFPCFLSGVSIYTCEVRCSWILCLLVVESHVELELKWA